MERRASRATLVCVLLALAPVIVGCAGSSSRSTTPTDGVAPIGSLPGPAPAMEDGSIVTTTTESPDAPGETADLPELTTTIAPLVPDTGVPGLDDDTALCAAWARYAGSTQLLAIASNFGGLDPVAMARLEVLASPVVSAAVADLDRLLPAQVDDERRAFVDDVVGPAGRRATRAQSDLTDAGADRAALDAVAAAWLDTLRTHDPESPVPEVADLDPVVSSYVDAAAARLAGELVPFATDPSLDTSAVSTPRTTALLAERCPDLTAYGVGDAI